MTESEKAKPITDYSNIPNKIRTTIMVGLSLGMLLACLDQTIIATSLPSILSSLGGTENFAWVITSYLLAETIMIPIAGKMSDIYGRKKIFLIGMIVFLAGSILSGLSTNITMLIVFRAIQGLGGGILLPVATATVADLYAPRDRGKIQGLLGALFAVTSCIGPFLGGLIVDYASWNWVFYVNIPVGIIAIAFTMLKFPKIQSEIKHHIDFLGIAVLSAFLLVLLLIFTWGGTTYAWTSSIIVSMALACLALFALFIFIESKVKEPVLPLRLFKENPIALSCIGILVMGLGMFGIMAYMPSFMQNVIGISATNSGEVMIPMVAGLMLTSISSGVLAKRTGYKPWLIVGPPIAATAMFMLSTLQAGDSLLIASTYTFFTGLGLGCLSSMFMVAAQNVSQRKDLGVVTSSVNLFRSIGSTIGVGILATIINNRIGTELAANLPTEIYSVVPHTTSILDYLKSGLTLLVPYQDAIITAYGNSVCFGFFVGGIIVLLVLFAGIAIKNVPLKSAEEYNRFDADLKVEIQESGKKE